MPHNTTPALVRRTATAVLAISAPLSLTVLASWAFEVWPPMHARPYLVIMVYLLLLAITLGAATVASVAHCHITVGRAFAAGVRAVQQSQEPPRPTVARVGLRAVE